jgi:hypothetical protein
MARIIKMIVPITIVAVFILAMQSLSFADCVNKPDDTSKTVSVLVPMGGYAQSAFINITTCQISDVIVFYGTPWNSDSGGDVIILDSVGKTITTSSSGSVTYSNIPPGIHTIAISGDDSSQTAEDDFTLSITGVGYWSGGGFSNGTSVIPVYNNNSGVVMTFHQFSGFWMAHGPVFSNSSTVQPGTLNDAMSKTLTVAIALLVVLIAVVASKKG